MQSKWGNKKDSDSDLDFDDDDEDVTESKQSSSIQQSDKKTAPAGKINVDEILKKLVAPACRNIGLQGEITAAEISQVLLQLQDIVTQ